MLHRNFLVEDKQVILTPRKSSLKPELPSTIFVLRTMSLTLKSLPKTIARPKLRRAAGYPTATVAPQPVAPPVVPDATIYTGIVANP